LIKDSLLQLFSKREDLEQIKTNLLSYVVITRSNMGERSKRMKERQLLQIKVKYLSYELSYIILVQKLLQKFATPLPLIEKFPFKQKPSKLTTVPPFIIPVIPMVSNLAELDLSSLMKFIIGSLSIQKQTKPYLYLQSN
jgi:hypothetical protein